MTKIFFATDVHGSDICWNKFINAGKFYEADVLVLGGDMTGKAVVPIINQGNSTYRASLLEHVYDLHTEAEVRELEKRIKSRGYYPYRTTTDEIAELNGHPQRIEALFRTEALKTLESWLEFAARKLAGSHIRCYVCPGNDDFSQVDELIRQSEYVQLAEGQVIQLDKHHEMMSSGWTNPTPWHTFREEAEADLRRRYDAMIAGLRNPRTSIFNIHVPPYGSMLDSAPDLDENLRPKLAGNAVRPVGSQALREGNRETSTAAGFAWSHPRKSGHSAYRAHAVHQSGQRLRAGQPAGGANQAR